MYKKLFFAAVLLTLVSCSKDFDIYEGPQQPTQSTEADVKSNFKSLFGVDYAADMDWSTTTTGQVSIQVDPSVKKVQLLVDVEVIKNATEYQTPNEVRVLNEMDTNGSTSFTMCYDAPKVNRGIYVGFQTDETYVVQKLEGSSVKFEKPVTSRATRGVHPEATLPKLNYVLGAGFDTYRSGYPNQAGDGKLYELADTTLYRLMKMPCENYGDFQDYLQTFVLGTFPNGKKDASGKKINNLDKVYATGYVNELSYGYTTSPKVPVIVTPVYKRDGAPDYGSEIFHSDLYYYYYSDADYEAAPNKTAFLRALPKFKAIPFNVCYGIAEDQTFDQKGSFALLYYGENKESYEGVEGSFEFPAGTRIGFMIRAKTDEEEGVKKGEVYLDGRLNDFINKEKSLNFRSSELDSNDPRAVWLGLGGRLFLSWESGTDKDFNDIILEVQGLSGIVPPPPFYPQVFTFCFEDTPKGDYDLNDLVIKAYRTKADTVVYYIAACGAHDSIFVKNVPGISENVEVHAMFGVSQKTFINTENGKYMEPIKSIVKVDKTFTFMEKGNQPWIYDASINHTVKLSETGQDPHGIMLCVDFDYPLERVRVNQAYTNFNDWVVQGKMVRETNWYTNPTEGRIYIMRVND